MRKRKKITIVILLLLLIALSVFYGKDIYNIVNFMIANDYEGLSRYMDSISVKSYIVLGSLQFIQIIFAALPSEFVQIAAFLTFGPIWGFILIYFAVIFGSSCVYIITKIFKSYKVDVDEDKVNMANKKYEKRSITMSVFLLYFLPAIPYGFISYYASSKKISFLRFIFITLIGVIPSIMLTLLGTGLIKKLYLNAGVIILFILLIIGILFVLISSYEKKIDECYKYNIYRKPNFLLFYLLRFTYVPYLKHKYKVQCNIDQTMKAKKPFVLLSTHQDAYDFVWASICCGIRRYNAVAARYYFYNTWLRRLLISLGAFPKDLFNQDISAIKQMMNTIKNDQILLMMPEGRLSTVGYNEEIVESTAKLLKKLKVDVYGMKTQGAYYSLGKGFKTNNVSKIELSSFLLVSKEELATLSLGEIDDRLNRMLSYDDDLYMKKNPDLVFKYVPDTSRLSGLIYSCPNCYSKSSYRYNKVENKIECSNCGYDLKLDKRYNLIHDNKICELSSLKDVHLNDIEIVKRELIDDFTISSKVKLRANHGKNKKIIEVGEGTLVFTKDALSYFGTIDGVTSTLTFSASNLKAIPFAISDSFEIYRMGEFYAFCPIENPHETIKWVMYIEENYKMRYKNG